MHVSNRVQKTLDAARVPYQVCEHRLAYTAQEVAAAQHVRGKDLAKCVILKAGNRFAMAVLPASYHVDLDRLRRATGAEEGAEVRLAHEEEFTSLFPDSEAGAMAPFGNLYDMSVYIDRVLEEDEEIVFNAGTHTQTIRMNYLDYKRVVNPVVVEFASKG